MLEATTAFLAEAVYGPNRQDYHRRLGVTLVVAWE